MEALKCIGNKVTEQGNCIKCHSYYITYINERGSTESIQNYSTAMGVINKVFKDVKELTFTGLQHDQCMRTLANVGLCANRMEADSWLQK